MNFMPATVEGDTVKLPIGDVRLPAGGARAPRAAPGTELIAGIRPENFEDAAPRRRCARPRHHLPGARSTWSSRWARSSTPTSAVESDSSIESAELRELAEDAGGGEVPMAGEEGRIVARLDPASKVKQGEEAELWVDAERLQLFDPEDGSNLLVESGAEPAAATA